MSGRPIKKGSTDQSTVIRIIDSTAFTPEEGVEHNTAGIDLWYRREGATRTAITEAALTALDDAHSDGGIEHIDDGYYRLDLPDAAFATGANGVQVGGTVTGMIVIGTYHPLVDYDPQDTVRLGLTALPNAAAEGAGGLYTRGTGAGQIAQDANGTIRAGLADDAITAAKIADDAISSEHINTGAITADAFAADAIVAATLATGAITSDAFAADAIVAATLATGAITSDAFAANAISATAIADNTITAAKIAGDAITADKIADDAIGDEHWNVSGVALAAGAITDASLAGNMEIVFETDFGTNYNATRNAWVTNAQDFVGTTAADPFNGQVVAASVTGAVGSVTGNVGGNVAGSVASVTAGVSLADDAITAAKFDETTAFPLASADSGATAVARTGADGDTLETISDQIDDVPTNAELATAVADVSVDEIQASALADLFNTDSGTTYGAAVSGSVVAEIADNAGGSSLTLDDIADAVWDEAQAGHTGAGTFGLYLDSTVSTAGGGSLTAEDIADAVWDEAATGHTDAGKAGAQLWTDIDAILEDTNELQADDYPTSLAAIITDTEDIQGRLPAALVSGRMSSDAVAISGSTTAADNVEANIGNLDAPISTTDTVCDNIYSIVNGDHGLVSIQDDIDLILADTNELQTNQGNWLTAEGFSTHSANDVLTALGNGSWATEAGGTGDHLTALPLHADWQDGGRLDLILDAVVADTNELQSDDYPATLATLATAASLTTVEGKIDTIDGIVDNILADTGTTLDTVVDNIYTLLAYIAPPLIGTVDDAGTGTETYVYGGVTVTYTVDEDGNRTNVAIT